MKMKLTDKQIEYRMQAFKAAAEYLKNKFTRDQFSIAANQIRNWGEEWKKKTLDSRKP